MRTISLTLPVILLSTLFLSACSSTPTSLKLTPNLNDNITINKVEKNQKWLLDSKDFRTARYLIAISAGDDVATLVNESISTRISVEKLLQNHWTKQGYRFTDNQGNSHQIEVQLIKLLAEVEQGTLSHETDINVIIKIQLNSDKSTFSKTFRSHYEEKAAFSADVEVLATQLNTQLSQLLDQIVQDPELNDKLLQL
ncbi:YajG family lipoprotein [Psychromonas sp. Urea-02u-13]|uniref:YajG family lipoprotein n=1 Tax=Psychromonas sp. Urea-02u-13 TaxID=2058326 RepID=UPI001E393A69|nr:YajG family lipoprotein [Psychromonas sp. Urea-02u-13]